MYGYLYIHTLSRRHILFDYTWIMNGHIKMRAVLVVALQVSISMNLGPVATTVDIYYNAERHKPIEWMDFLKSKTIRKV